MKINKFFSTVALCLVASLAVIPVTKVVSQNYINELVGTQFKEQLDCLAQNIYYEAGNETQEGKLAVAQVTLNRVNSGKFASSICGVVHQKDKINGTTICQFSWACQAVKATFRNQKMWEESMSAARIALTEPIAHRGLYKTNAMYYHATYVDPGWNLIVVSKIGNHIFYRDRSSKI